MLLNKRIPFWYILGKIKGELLAVSFFTAIIAAFDQNVTELHLAIPLAVPSILGTTISLLLAFRTNQSYDRWWEARLLWGSIVNNSRTFIRQVRAFHSEGRDNEFLKPWINRQIAWCYVLGEKLRGLSSEATINKYLSQDEIQKISGFEHSPNAILLLHQEAIRKAFDENKIDSIQQVRLEDTLSSLTDAMGACERIKSTIFPKTYSALLHSLIYIFATIFPLSLANFSVFIEIILTITLLSVFFLIEKTSVYKQDPFENRPTDTPMTAIAEKIENNLREIVGLEAISREAPKSYYLM